MTAGAEAGYTLRYVPVRSIKPARAGVAHHVVHDLSRPEGTVSALRR